MASLCRFCSGHFSMYMVSGNRFRPCLYTIYAFLLTSFEIIYSDIWTHNARFVQQYYLPSARELARLAGVCKAPMIQHFSETISGAVTIRSFDQESRFQDTNMKLIDGYTRPKFHIAAAMQWLCLRLNMLSALTFAFSLVFLISVPEGFIDPGK